MLLDISVPEATLKSSVKADNFSNRPSKISKMETDEHETKEDDCMEVEEEKQEENGVVSCISRCLDVTWNEQCDLGNFIVKDTMSAILEGTLSQENYPELISEIINEMVRQHLTGALTKEVEVNSASDQILSNVMRNDDIEMDLEESKFIDSSRSKQTKTCTPKEAAMYYLVASFNRSLPERQEISNECRQQLIKTAIALLDHHWIFGVEPCAYSQPRTRSPLLQVMYDETISYHEFVRHLMSEVYENHPKRFTKIFNVIIEDIYLDMRCKQIKSIYTLPTHSIDRLIELISMPLLNNENLKPVCNLVVSHPTFMPELCSDIPGREISHVSYLSPFLSISILVYDRFYDEDNTIETVIQSDLQNKLDFVRTKLHNLFYIFILNKDTRDQVLKYISELLNQNAKRTQYNADERSLSQDGFMLNLMAVSFYSLNKIRTHF